MTRPEGYENFFVPGEKKTVKVDASGCFKTGCRKLLGKGDVHPTWNQVRKWFHKKLMELTADKEKLKRAMVFIDAHSVHVQGTNYVLRDPADDVALAKMLVDAVLGDTVPWPTPDSWTSAEKEKAESIIKSAIYGSGDDNDRFYVDAFVIC